MSKIESKPFENRELGPRDFDDSIRLNFPAAGSAETPAHKHRVRSAPARSSAAQPRTNESCVRSGLQVQGLQSPSVPPHPRALRSVLPPPDTRAVLTGALCTAQA